MVFPLHFNRWKHYLLSKNIKISVSVPKATNVMSLLLLTLVYAVSSLICCFISIWLFYYYNISIFGLYHLLARFIFPFILFLFPFFLLCMALFLPFFFISSIFPSFFLSFPFFSFFFLSLFLSFFFVFFSFFQEHRLMIVLRNFRGNQQ